MERHQEVRENVNAKICHVDLFPPYSVGDLHVLDIRLQFFKTYTCICYEMDKTSISMFEILEPGGSALGKYSI